MLAVFALNLLAFAAAESASAGVPPVRTESVVITERAPVEDSGGERRYLEAKLIFARVGKLRSGDRLRVEAACKLSKSTRSDSRVLLAPPAEGERHRYTIGLFVSRLLQRSPDRCELTVSLTRQREKTPLIVSRHCYRAGKTTSGRCETKPRRN